METKNYTFTSSDVSDIVGITPIYLNALIQRKLYGISPSISDRHGEMKLRIFSEEDVFGIALVWMLFEAGLRTRTIRDILLELVEIDDANAAAEHLSRPGRAHLVIIRESSKPKSKARPKLRVEPTLTEELIGLVKESVQKYPTANILLVPVGAKFAEIEKKIAAMYGE
jgi:hypothetical protein